MTAEQREADLAKRREYSQRPEVKERARKHQREYMREYNQDPERRERNAARSRAWYAANRERALAKAKEDHIKRKRRECAKTGYERQKQNDPEGLRAIWRERNRLHRQKVKEQRLQAEPHASDTSRAGGESCEL